MWESGLSLLRNVGNSNMPQQTNAYAIFIQWWSCSWKTSNSHLSPGLSDTYSCSFCTARTKKWGFAKTLGSLGTRDARVRCKELITQKESMNQILYFLLCNVCDRLGSFQRSILDVSVVVNFKKDLAFFVSCLKNHLPLSPRQTFVLSAFSEKAWFSCDCQVFGCSVCECLYFWDICCYNWSPNWK